MADRLYFEELSYERVLDIYELEHAGSAVVSFGGQLPQNIALKLQEVGGVKILGTNPLVRESIPEASLARLVVPEGSDMLTCFTRRTSTKRKTVPNSAFVQLLAKSLYSILPSPTPLWRVIS